MTQKMLAFPGGPGVKAIRFHGPGDLRLEDVPRPEPGEGDVLVQVEVALTDGTDLKAYRRGHPRLLASLPSPFGHEFCGVDVATGRRVVAANSDADEGRREVELLNGAYAEFLLVPEPIARVNLHRVPRRRSRRMSRRWSSRSRAAFAASSSPGSRPGRRSRFSAQARSG